MNKSVRLIVTSTFTLLGILCIVSGFICIYKQPEQQSETVLVIVQKKQIEQEIQPTITPKNIEIMVNTPLSVKIVDYLANAVTDEVLAYLTLDTSTVNVTVAGTYSYTITYKDTVYTGTIVVKENPITATQNITLKPLNIKVGEILTNNISDYIVETITDETKALMKLDISQVNNHKAGTYQYSITYNNSIYTGTITVTEDQPTLSTSQNEDTKDGNEQILTEGTITDPTTQTEQTKNTQS